MKPPALQASARPATARISAGRRNSVFFVRSRRTNLAAPAQGRENGWGSSTRQPKVVVPMWKWIHCALAAAAALAAAQAFCQVPAAPITDFSRAEAQFACGRYLGVAETSTRSSIRLTSKFGRYAFADLVEFIAGHFMGISHAGWRVSTSRVRVRVTINRAPLRPRRRSCAEQPVGVLASGNARIDPASVSSCMRKA